MSATRRKSIFRQKWIFTLGAILVVIAVANIIFSDNYNFHSAIGGITLQLAQNEIHVRPQGQSLKTKVILVVVACGQKRRVRSNVLTLIKSAIFFSRGVHLHVILYKDEETDLGQEETLDMQLKKLQKSAESLELNFDYEIRDSSFPESKDVDWRAMYRPCTTLRLFLPTLLPTVDAVMYLDADIVFLSSLKELWNFFLKMDGVQLMSMAANSEPPATGYYDPKLKFPYYGPRGLNAGVALMNLTRMRQVDFEKSMADIVQEFPGILEKADQDLINIYFSRRPGSVTRCKGHCVCSYANTGNCSCASAEEKGIALAHGNMKGFEHLPFKVIQQHFITYELESKRPKILYKQILGDWEEPKNEWKNTCLKPGQRDKMLQRFQKYLSTQS